MTESDKTLRDEVVELADRIHRLSESTGIIERAAAHEYAVRQLRGILARHPVAHPADVIPWGVWHSATHAAKDSDGESRLYNCEPYIDEAKGRWMGKDAAAPYGRWATLEFGDRSDCRIHGPWRDSLRKRPEGV